MEFIKITLGEISVGKGQYGIGASAVEYSKDLYTYLRITDINDDGTLNMLDLKSVDDKKAAQYVMKPNDIVFARTGNSTGRNYFYDGSDGTFVYAGFLIKFSIDPSKVNPKYIKYYCLSNEYKNWVRGHSTGSTRGNINAQTYANMEITLPPRAQQDKLVSILENLDLKRKNNAEINRNLSEQLKVIFSKMFPTIADNGSNTLEEIISFSNGKKRPDTEGKVPVYGGNGILSYTDKSNAENCVIIGRVGAYCGSLYLSIEPCWISDNAIKAEAKNSKSQMFIYYLLQELALSNRHIGTSQPLLTQGILNAIPFTCPSEEGIISFCKKADDIQKLIDMNTIENKRLSELRDTLLSKLMSGELDVSDLNI